jgi:DNA-binding IclR family transcriptional regulator
MSNPLVTGSRSLAVIELVAQRRGGVSFTAIAAELGLSSASLTRLLKMLLVEEWILQDGRTAHYVPGHRMMQLGKHMRAQSRAADLVAPIVQELANQSGHSACFAVSQGFHFLLLAKAEKRKSYRFMDLLVPNLDWIDNSMGQFLLAFQNLETARSIYRNYFRMDIPREHIDRFETLRSDRFFVHDEGQVTRIMAAVAPDTERPVESLISIAALSPDVENVQTLLKEVKAAASKAQHRLVTTMTPLPSVTYTKALPVSDIARTTL